LTPILDPIAKLLSNLSQILACEPLCVPIGIEEANHAFGLLERLNQSVEKNAVKTAVTEFDVIVVMFAEGVHRALLLSDTGNLEPVNPLGDNWLHKAGSHCRCRKRKRTFSLKKKFTATPSGRSSSGSREQTE
jgi:hypothetical protein